MGWKDIIKTVAPVLGTAFGGPAGGMAVKFFADKVLGNPDATEADIEAWTLTASPSDMLKVKLADQSFKIEMKKLGIDVMKLDVADRASARILAQADMTPHIILSTVYTLGYIGLLYFLMTGQVVIAKGTEGMIGPIVGVLTAAQVQIMNFWFGSSSGSKAKTAQMTGMVR